MITLRLRIGAFNMNNFEKIKQMSIEEVARLLLDSCGASKCEEQPQNEYGSVNCFECRMNWLKDEAK